MECFWKKENEKRKTLLLYQCGWHGNLCCLYLEVELQEDWLGSSTKCRKKQKWMQPLCCDWFFFCLFFFMQQDLRRHFNSLIQKVFGNRVLSFSSLVFLVLIILSLPPSRHYAKCHCRNHFIVEPSHTLRLSSHRNISILSRPRTGG